MENEDMPNEVNIPNVSDIGVCITDDVIKRRFENDAMILSLAKSLETINVKNGTSHQRCLAASSMQQAIVYLDMDSQMLGGLDLFNSSSPTSRGDSQGDT